ncbi:Cu,Zn superoxide dismutase-like protein [Sporormia fimetaria CBS 119925]|uniref:superoxide dismutase n=1 Tax=Sporormia fimetaria CBS 119925 TaxID=1340428 RepID=A0A6A6VG93_9PLEO|nr:Cu,Zn superoxide dismutase-like protein [Sporormia fimetaria CBS 119925]
MRFTICAVIAAASAVSAQTATSTVTPAPEVTNNVEGVSYVAELPEKGTVRGSVVGTSASDGKGVQFKVSISGLPAEGGPFMYHIHEKPVPADGNCTGTGAHLDPYKRGEVPPCDASQKETCQTGDNSGKYGNLTTPAHSQEYLDLYSSTNPEDPSFFGNLSIVVHFSNKTRITCANFTLAEGSAQPSSGYSLPTGAPNSTHSAHPTGTGDASSTTDGATFTPGTPTPSVEPSNGAGRLVVAGAAVLAGAVALVL